MNTDELEKSWAVTPDHLETARALLLPVLIINNEELDSMERYHEMLAANELELALNELAALGEIKPVPRIFWEALNVAADNMGLRRHVEALSLNSRSSDS